MSGLGGKKDFFVISAGTVILIGLIILALHSPVVDEQDYPLTMPGMTDVQVYESIDTNTTPAIFNSAISPTNLKAEEPVRPDVSMSPDHGAELLDALQSSFDSRSLTSQIRLQQQLKKYWESNPPSAEELVGLISDTSAPSAFRIYMAKVFRNRVKMQSYDAGAVSVSTAAMRSVIADSENDSVFRAELATILTTVDHNDATIRAVAPLLMENDESAAMAVSALCNTTNQLAIEVLYDFLTNDENLLESKPQALMEALRPLSTTDKDLLPIVNYIFSNTLEFAYYQNAIEVLIHTPSSAAVLKSIAMASSAAQRFKNQQMQAEYLCRVAAQQHIQLFRLNHNKLDAATVKAIEKLLNTGNTK